MNPWEALLKPVVYRAPVPEQNIRRGGKPSTNVCPMCKIQEKGVSTTTGYQQKYCTECLRDYNREYGRLYRARMKGDD